MNHAAIRRAIKRHPESAPFIRREAMKVRWKRARLKKLEARDLKLFIFWLGR